MTAPFAEIADLGVVAVVTAAPAARILARERDTDSRTCALTRIRRPRIAEDLHVHP